ncbi:MAG: IS4 family transposase [Deltaproteobacteria bacterium]|nr:IS4 family transposase [Deltaproteobacteria bacterium]
MAESITLVSMMLQALKQVPVQDIFDRDPYESRRTALKGQRLLGLLVAFQMIKSRFMRGLVEAVEENQPLQAAVGGPVALNTLSNALAHRSVEQMVEAWMLVLQSYGGAVERLGKKFARIALIDASLIKLSLAAYDWAQYRKHSGAAKMHAVLQWAKGIPEQLVVTAGKVHDANEAVGMVWKVGWTYVQDRGYVSFKRLAQMLACGAHFVVRLKRGMHWSIVERRPVPTGIQAGGIRLLSDWTVRLWGWPEPLLRIVSYRLPDGRVVRVLTDRFDLVALSVARLYKERWKIVVSRLTMCLSSRWKSGRGKRSAPRSWDGRVVGNLSPEAHRQDLRKGRCNSPGCNSSERRGSLVTRVPVAETVYNARRQQASSHLI